MIIYLVPSLCFERPQHPFLEYRRRRECIVPEPIRHAFSTLVAAAKSRRTPFPLFLLSLLRLSILTLAPFSSLVSWTHPRSKMAC